MTQSASSRTPPDDVSAFPNVNLVQDILFQRMTVIAPLFATVIPTDSDELLDIFQHNLARQVPFVSVPAQATSETLSRERPFLYRAIIASSSFHDSVRQTELGQEFLRQLTDSLLFREKEIWTCCKDFWFSSLGNVPSLPNYLGSQLIHMSHRYNGLCHARSQLTTVLGIAFSLVVDLHLYMPLTTLENHERFLDEMKDIISFNQATCTRRAPPTKDERRVMLACFYLLSCVSDQTPWKKPFPITRNYSRCMSAPYRTATPICRDLEESKAGEAFTNIFSQVSSSFYPINPLHWTPYLQHCYDDISNAPENDNDIYLTQLAGIQRISEDVKHSGIRGIPSQLRVWTPAVEVHFKLLMSDLQKYWAALPQSLQKDGEHAASLHSCSLSIAGSRN